MMPTIHKIPGWMWATVVGVGTVIAAILGVINFWEKIDDLVQGSVKQATIQITEKVLESEQRIGGFLADDLRERVIVTEDIINSEYKEERKPVPMYLIRQQRMMEERLEEAKEKWEK